MASPEVHPIKSNFTSGQVSPLLLSREDITRYEAGAIEMTNFLPLIQGGAFKRSALFYVANTKDNQKVRNIPFIFNESDSYNIEVGETYFRFFSNNSQVTELPIAVTNISQATTAFISAAGHSFSNGDRVVITSVLGMTEMNNIEITVANQVAGGFEAAGINSTAFTAYGSGGTASRIFEVTTPYTAAEITEIDFAESADIMYVTHKNHEPRKLIRSGPTTWTFAPAVFVPVGKFTPVGDRPALVSFFDQRLVFGRTNNKPISLFLSKAGDLADFTVGTNPDDAIENNITQLKVNELRWILPTGKVLGVGTEGAELAGGSGDFNEGITPLNFRVLPHTTHGSAIHKPISFDSSTIYIQRAKRKLREFTYNFERDGFISSDLTVISDQILFDQAIDGAYQEEPNNNIWISTTDGPAAVMTYQKEQQVAGWCRVKHGGKDAKIESVNVIPGLTQDEVWAAVSLEIGGQTVRHMCYLKDRFVATETNRKEDAIFSDSSLSFIATPFTISVISQADPGVITTDLSHGLSNGDIFRIRAVEGMLDGAGDEVLNDRSFKAANVTATTVEITDQTTGANIDTSALTAYARNGEIRKEVNAISNLNHLIGEKVVILANGRDMTPKTVDVSGRIGLDFFASKVHIGIKYKGRVETLPQALGNQQGSSHGKIRVMARVGMRVYQTLGGRVGVGDGELSDIKLNKKHTTMDQAAPLYTGIIPHVYTFNSFVDPTENKEFTMVFEHDQPLPATILCFVPEYEVAA